MKRYITALVIVMAWVLVPHREIMGAEENPMASRIVSAKLYQNQAKITRSVRITLAKGTNTVIIGGLPKLLYDWSMRGSLPKSFSGKILSLEVEQKALIKKRQQLIAKIEERLEGLREKDQVLADELKNLHSQEKFLNSILDFTNQTVSRELATRIPQVTVWDNTLEYVAAKRSVILRQKRKTEREREALGKEIQKWEFELSQIAGHSYFRNYQSLNSAIMNKRSSVSVQQFADVNNEYSQRDEFLKRPTEKIDVEKRAIVSIYSAVAAETEFTLSYQIPNTYWQMLYDVRASRENRGIDLVIYANIYQKTEEDWEDIQLSLSTGSPVLSVTVPSLAPWYLDIYTPYYPSSPSTYGGVSKSKQEAVKEREELSVTGKEDRAPAPETKIEEKGMFFEAALPLNHTIQSSDKYQKKYIKDFRIADKDKVSFYYQCIPQRDRNGFLRVKTFNTTPLPWLGGEAQVFLENEFLGKVGVPHTSIGQEIDFVLGVESRIVSKKELLKKYEDTSGVFGGNRRILYSYRITLENSMPGNASVVVLDTVPVSKNEKIKAELEKVSLPFLDDEKERKTSEYLSGIRKWKLEMKPGEKREITYEAVITFDKKESVRGLH